MGIQNTLENISVEDKDTSAEELFLEESERMGRKINIRLSSFYGGVNHYYPKRKPNIFYRLYHKLFCSN